MKGAGQILDLTLVRDKKTAIAVKEDVEAQKKFFENYTSGHSKRGVL